MSIRNFGRDPGRTRQKGKSAHLPAQTVHDPTILTMLLQNPRCYLLIHSVTFGGLREDLIVQVRAVERGGKVYCVGWVLGSGDTCEG